MYIDFSITPNENIVALVKAENPEARMGDLELGTPTELVADQSGRNTSLTLTGTVDGVYAGQALDVKYNRRQVSDTEVTTGVLTVEVPFESVHDEVAITALFIAQCVVDGAESYLQSDFDVSTLTVTLTPTADGALCLDGELVVTLTVADEVATLADDVTVTELDGFNAPE